MNRNRQIGFGVMFFIIGMILRLTPALSIIHELMHYGWCNVEGIKVTSLQWARITYSRESILVIYGGYMTESLLYAIIVLITSRHKIVSSFFLGILVMTLVSSFFSLDFNYYAAKTVSPEGIVRNLWLWGLLSGSSMIGVLRVYFSGWKAKDKAKVYI